MKKLSALLVALAILISTCAFALNGQDYPVWDGTSSGDNKLYGSIAGEKLVLGLDSGAEYSSISDGTVQVCFYAFDAAQKNYLELYLQMPETVSAGDTFSAGGSSPFAVTLYEVSLDSEDFYYVSQETSAAYPDINKLEVSIESVTRNDENITVSGSLNALLAKLVSNVPTGETLALDGVRFHFTLPLKAVPGPRTSQAPLETQPPQFPGFPQETPEASLPPQLPAQTAAPQPTLDPHPAFTLPPDYVVL